MIRSIAKQKAKPFFRFNGICEYKTGLSFKKMRDQNANTTKRK